MNTVQEIFGEWVFNDDVMKKRLPEDVYLALSSTIATGKTIDPAIADTVAEAMKNWAIEKGATHYTHWFQPLTGVTAEKHDAFLSPVDQSHIVTDFSGKELIHGESDASSFPSGGLRATFEARGYTAWDPSSFAFVKDGTLYIPTAFCSYTGEALDAKTPLLRSMQALNVQALRILRLLGDKETAYVSTTVGAEQEYFLIPRDLYDQRPDLKYTGRTLFGAPAPKGQELDDHYYGSLRTSVAQFMSELDETLWKLGIPAKTKHNEAAPSQHELAPVYMTTNCSVDQNMLIMEYMKRIAEKRGFACLLHEKPFAGVNGSGKHNNWSMTNGKKNLLNPGSTPAENRQFLLILAGILQAVDDYQDLMRISVASPSNDHRLGGNEAPPAIVSVFVGEELEGIINAIITGRKYNGKASVNMDLGLPTIPLFSRDTTDRNRTSPFAFTGTKFEFRMPGSSQNMALPNTVLNTAVAESFRKFADELEQYDEKEREAEIAKLIRCTFRKHKRILYSGNGYSREWEKEAEKRGLSNLRTSVDAYGHMLDRKNLTLFNRHHVMSPSEVKSRQEINYENYAKIINIEALTMLQMMHRQILPCVQHYEKDLAILLREKQEQGVVNDFAERDLLLKLSELNDCAYRATNELKDKERIASAITDARRRANAYCDMVLPAMERLRTTVDAMETLVPAEYWTLPNYGQLIC